MLTRFDILGLFGPRYVPIFVLSRRAHPHIFCFDLPLASSSQEVRIVSEDRFRWSTTIQDSAVGSAADMDVPMVLWSGGLRMVGQATACNAMGGGNGRVGGSVTRHHFVSVCTSLLSRRSSGKPERTRDVRSNPLPHPVWGGGSRFGGWLAP